LVFADRHHERPIGVVDAGGNLAFESALERALEVAQRLRAGLADAGVLVLGGDDVLLAARLDARQLQLFAEDLGDLLHREFDFEDVAARLIAGAGIVAFGRGERLSRIALALADAPRALLSVAELRDVDLRQGNRHQVSALLADHFAAADILAEIRFHLTA